MEKMDLGEIRIKEMQIDDDLKELFKLYDFNDLFTIDDISEGVTQITEVSRQYRHIHIELKNMMGDEDYTAGYPKCEEVIEEVRKYVSLPLMSKPSKKGLKMKLPIFLCLMLTKLKEIVYGLKYFWMIILNF